MGADGRRRAVAVLGFALLLICARWQLGDLSAFASAQDLDFFDESQYLTAGVHASGLSQLHAQWAPPYCLWYRLLFRITGDTIAAYHLNAYLLAIALPALWYLACVALRIRGWWAFASALAWLISTANLETLRVGNFAACIVLGALIVASLFRRETWRWWIALAGLWVAAFVRPELNVAAVLAAAIGAWQLSRTSTRAIAVAWVGAALIPAIALSLAFGLPFGGGRSGAAFQQHLAGNIVEWHQLPFSAWIHYEDVIRRYYALPASAFDFLRHEPLAFLHHVATNLWRLMRESIGSALAPAPVLMEASRNLAVAALALTLLGALVARQRVRLAITPFSVVLGACGLLVLVSCAAIYPRAHYLPLLLIGVLLLVAPRAGEGGRDGELLAGGGDAIAMLIGACLFAVLPRYVAAHAPLPRPQQETVYALRALPLHQLQLLDDSGVLQVYLQVPVTRLGPRDLKPPFDAFVKERDVNAVVISPGLGLDPVLAPDPSWQRFVSDPAAFGFECRSIPRVDRTLCVRPGWAG